MKIDFAIMAELAANTQIDNNATKIILCEKDIELQRQKNIGQALEIRKGYNLAELREYLSDELNKNQHVVAKKRHIIKM